MSERIRMIEPANCAKILNKTYFKEVLIKWTNSQIKSNF